MQKKIIALAVAGLMSGVAFAQSNVTIYGTADATYDNVKATGATNPANAVNASRGRVTSNSSFIGFKGVEDLGGGLKAVWQFENGVNTENGAAGAWNNRDSLIALAGGFGTVAFGNLTGPARAMGAAMDVNAGATGIGANTALIGKIGGGAGAGLLDQRSNNAMAYISPDFGGFSARIAFVPNENKSTQTNAAGVTVDTKIWALGLNYANGPIYAAYAYSNLKDSGSTGFPLTTGLGALNLSKAADNRMAFKYDFGMGTVGFLWDQIKATTAGAGSVNVKQNVYYIPVTFKVGGAGKVIGQYGMARQPSGSAIAGGTDYKARHLVLGYEHSLSKRTTVKALYSAVTNKANASYDYLYGVTAANSTATAAGVSAGADPKGFSIGLRHTF